MAWWDHEEPKEEDMAKWNVLGVEEAQSDNVNHPKQIRRGEAIRAQMIKSDGGPASYYDFPPDWTTLNDYIEYKSGAQWGADSFHWGNITKAGCRWGDKEGTTKEYDAKKVVYSALRILRRLCGNKIVQDFLSELAKDPQFLTKKVDNEENNTDKT
jgi:hypothetical protein